jgi:hypothetical protein
MMAENKVEISLEAASRAKEAFDEIKAQGQLLIVAFQGAKASWVAAAASATAVLSDR